MAPSADVRGMGAVETGVTMNDTLPLRAPLLRLLAGLAAAALLGLHEPAAAAIDCWAVAEHPGTADQLPVTDARVAPLRRTVQAVNALLQRQPALHELPRSRLRSSWQLSGQWTAPARGAHFLLRDHAEPMWRPGCTLHPGADRIEPRASIVVTINAPESFFHDTAPVLRDEQFSAWIEEPATGQVQGHTLYGGHQLVFTAHGRLPWVPVSNAEMLAFVERDLLRRIDEQRQLEARAQAAATPAAQQEQFERIAQSLRRTLPDQAEALIAELRAGMARDLAAQQAAEARRRARPGVDNNPWETQLRQVRAWRDGLGPQQLAAQARLGVDGRHARDVPPERYPTLARPDPAFPWDPKDPNRAQMIKVSVRGNGEFAAPMQRVLQTLDLAALQALVAPH